MRVFVNGEARDISGPVSLTELLDLLSLPSERIAIELNQQVVRKKDWQDISIAEADRIEIVHFVGGG